MISVVLALVIVGILLFCLNSYVTIMDGRIKKIINVFVIVCVILWLVFLVFGSHFHDIPVPRL